MRGAPARTETRDRSGFPSRSGAVIRQRGKFVQPQNAPFRPCFFVSTPRPQRGHFVSSSAAGSTAFAAAPQRARVNAICSSRNASSVPSPSAIAWSASSHTAVLSGYVISSGSESTRNSAAAVGVSTFFFPAACKNRRRIKSSIIVARVASVPMPDTARSVFFAASSRTNLWMSFIAANSVEGVNRWGGFVSFSASFPDCHAAASFFFIAGNSLLSPLSSFSSPSGFSAFLPA